jgi:hypothetical protein
VAAAYATHPHPESFALATLQTLYARALPGDDEASLQAVDEGALSRLLFVVAHVALKHVVYGEGLVKAIRRRRLEQERREMEANAEGSTQNKKADKEEAEEEEGIEAAVGGAAGAMMQEAELDTLREEAERAMVQGEGDGMHAAPVAAFAPLVVAVCQQRELLSAHPTLRSCAVLALCKLMVRSLPQQTLPTFPVELMKASWRRNPSYGGAV